MSDTARILEFISFCIEMYAARNSTSGQEVYGLFKRSGVLDYLRENYEPLHTQGFRYIFACVDGFIAGQETDSSASPEARSHMFVSDYFPNEKAFRAMLPGKIALTAVRLADAKHVDPLEALGLFYSSDTYRQLEDEQTKSWWESPRELCRDYLAANNA